MNKSLLLVVIFLGAFSIFKVILFILCSFLIKPKVDENGNLIKPATPEKKTKDDFWDDEDW